MSVFQSIQVAKIALDSIGQSLMENAVEVQPAKIGLDTRCGPIYAGRDYILVLRTHQKAVEYYGGLSYVDPECVIVLGSFVIYSAESPRVQQILEYI